jgi:hypothetical protein
MYTFLANTVLHIIVVVKYILLLSDIPHYCQYYKQYVFSVCKYSGFVWNIFHLPPDKAFCTPWVSVDPQFRNAGLAYDPWKLTRMKIVCVLNNNTVYCSFIFAVALWSQLNMKTSSWQLKPDSCQNDQHKTDCLTPDSCQNHTSLRLYHSLIPVSSYWSCQSLNLISVFSHCMNGTLLVRHGGLWLL